VFEPHPHQSAEGDDQAWQDQYHLTHGNLLSDHIFPALATAIATDIMASETALQCGYIINGRERKEF
jgi:hypothetical protein